MDKPTRIDNERILWLGGFLLRKMPKGSSTGYTSQEDYMPGDLMLYLPNGDCYPVEAKVVRQCFNTSRRLYPHKNSNWIELPKGLKDNNRYWMLNAIDGNGMGKGFLMRETGCALAYIFEDGVLWYTPSMLPEAFDGLGIYKTGKRQEFEKVNRSRTCQCKFLVDLEQGVWTPCTPPDELFFSATHEDFNRQNNAAES